MRAVRLLRAVFLMTFYVPPLVLYAFLTDCHFNHLSMRRRTYRKLLGVALIFALSVVATLGALALADREGGLKSLIFMSNRQ